MFCVKEKKVYEREFKLHGPSEGLAAVLMDDKLSFINPILQNLDGGRKMIEELSYEITKAIVDTLPVEISFVDKGDTVRYFNKEGRRIFPRSRAIIDRKVQDCHPQKEHPRCEQNPRRLQKQKARLRGILDRSQRAQDLHSVLRSPRC